MVFLQAQPSVGLQPYIMSYWAYQGQADTLLEDYSYPDGCQEIIFNVETEVFKQDDRGRLFRNPAIEVIGQLTEPYRVNARGSQLYFGVRFRPHGFSAFCPVIVGELNNQNVDARDILGGDIQSLSNHCQSLDAFSQFVQQADRYFKKKIGSLKSQNVSYGLVNSCIQVLQNTHHNCSIADLCERYSVSPRWLQIQFKKYVGISPKTLQKIFRFRSAINCLNSGDQKLTSVATELGYFDQAHFNRDFKALYGAIPKVYRERVHPINQHFLSASGTN